MQVIYLETGRNSNVFNRRGEAGPEDDSVSYAKMMGKRGLRVIVAGEDLGPKIDSEQNPVGGADA